MTARATTDEFRRTLILAFKKTDVAEKVWLLLKWGVFDKRRTARSCRRLPLCAFCVATSCLAGITLSAHQLIALIGSVILSARKPMPLVIQETLSNSREKSFSSRWLKKYADVSKATTLKKYGEKADECDVVRQAELAGRREQ